MTYQELFTKLEKRNPETGYDIVVLDEDKDFYDRVSYKQFNYVRSSDEMKDSTLYGESFLDETEENVGIEAANELAISLQNTCETIYIDLEKEVIIEESRFILIPDSSKFMLFTEEINIYFI